jgi:sortase A
MRRAARIAVVVLLALGGWQLGQGLWIPVKAEIAQLLLARAWARTQAGEAQVKPWPWADTWPVAKLTGDRWKRDLYVLADGTGRSLAFGPGHVVGTAMPGEPGLSIIGGHRDTHFSALRDARRGDTVELETIDGRTHRFRIEDTAIVDATDARMVLEGETPRLALVTCYPFDAIVPGGSLRYVVSAVETPATAAALPAALP